MLKVTFEHMSTAVLVFGADRQVVMINPAAEAVLELSARQAAGIEVERLLPLPNACLELIDTALRRRQVLSEGAVELRFSDERTVEVDCTVAPLTEGELTGGFLLELADVGQRLRVSREEQLLAQNESARVVLRGLAHEIRNPLGGLRGAAQLLAAEHDEPSVQEYTSVIIAEADRLQGLLQRMLGPRKPPRHEPVNVHEVTERVCALVGTEAPANVSVERDYDPSIPELTGDDDLLIQALLNIVRNAVQALTGEGNEGRGGRVLIRTRVQRNSNVGARLHRLVARIDVIDDGPGIPDGLKASLFYPMVTGRSNGTGLGLSIAQSLIAHHGGLIECSSNTSETQFSVLLPIDL